MKLIKLTEAEFNARMACTEAVPTIKVFAGDAPVKLPFCTIAANTYRSLVFVPCGLVGDHNWIRIFGATKLRNHRGDLKARTPYGDYKIIELDDNGVLFAFV